jgi:hypothetical protein
MMSNLTTSNAFSPTTLDEAMRFSDMLAKSSMVPKQYQGKPEDVMVAVVWGKEIGLAPLQALQNISVINGKPSVYGDAAMALVQNSPVCEGIEEYFEQENTQNPIAVCVASRKNRKPVIAKFSLEDAKRAGLWGKQGPWTAYPKRMMQMRARGFALRDAFPDVLKGLITSEEAQDYPEDNAPKAPLRNPLDALAPPKAPEIEMPAPDLSVINAELAEMSEPEEVIEQDAQVVEAVVVSNDSGWELNIPGKDPSYFPDYPSWAEAYEALAGKVAGAEKLLPRTRMTKLRELRQANENTIEKISTLERVNHTAAYGKRLKMLGAQLGEDEHGNAQTN